MSKEPAEFEVLLKHVDRAGTRAVDGHEEDAPVAPKESSGGLSGHGCV